MSISFANRSRYLSAGVPACRSAPAGFAGGVEDDRPGGTRHTPFWRILAIIGFAFAFWGNWLPASPVAITPVVARYGMVVAGHPQAAEIGLGVLTAGGNAVDAAVATSLALGVAEPYGSGLGGKLMLLFYEAKSGKVYAVDAMDACGSAIEVERYAARPEDAKNYGYGAVCVPGLPAGLWAAHRRWGARAWKQNVAPAADLARAGALVLPKMRDMFEEQEEKLRRGDAEIARIFLPDGRLPEVGTRLKNKDLAETLELFGAQGRDGFYRGKIAATIVDAARGAGGVLALEDFANYEARVVEPIEIEFHGMRIVSAPPPANGPAMFLTALKVLEAENFSRTRPLRSVDNLDSIGRVWRVVEPDGYRLMADTEESRFHFERLVAPDSIAAYRHRARTEKIVPRAATLGPAAADVERVAAATTHFIVADAQGNIVCATQSQSAHFGAGVVAPGTGIVLNDSMGNFVFADSKDLNYVAPGKRPRSTISPTLVLRDGKPLLALGLPGSTLIPTAMLQVLLDRLVFHRPLEQAICDARFHFMIPWRSGQTETFEAERSFPVEIAEALRTRGWRLNLSEEAGRGRRFGGVNALEINADGSVTGFADPRRTNAAVGY